jgi:uncharacterized protein YlaI
MDVMTIGTTSGTVTPAFQQQPYRAQRLGSGVRCPAYLEDTEPGRGGSALVCDSALTTRLRGGVDSLDRPIAEYLCETCESVFVAITVALDTRVKWEDVRVDPMGMEARPATPVAAALRRTERQPREVVAAKMARLEVCTQCQNVVATDNGEWEAHQRAHLED